MGDQDKTPRFRGPLTHGDGPDRRDPQQRSYPHGVPIVPSAIPSPESEPADSDPAEPTDSFDLVAILDAEPTAKDREVVRRSKRDSGERVTFDQLVRIIRTLLGRTAAVEGAVAAIDKTVAPIVGIRKWVLGGLGTTLVAVGIFLYTRGGDERKTRLRIQDLERSRAAERAERIAAEAKAAESLREQLGEIHRDIRALERRGDNHHKDSP
jgi:hypothetical protein